MSTHYFELFYEVSPVGDTINPSLYIPCKNAAHFLTLVTMSEDELTTLINNADDRFVNKPKIASAKLVKFAMYGETFVVFDNTLDAPFGVEFKTHRVARRGVLEFIEETIHETEKEHGDEVVIGVPTPLLAKRTDWGNGGQRLLTN